MKLVDRLRGLAGVNSRLSKAGVASAGLGGITSAEGPKWLETAHRGIE